MKKFDLQQEYTIELIPLKPAVTVIINTLSRTIEDSGEQVTAKVIFDQLPEPMIIALWDSSTTPTYNEIGDWTDKMANDRILEVLKGIQ